MYRIYPVGSSGYLEQILRNFMRLANKPKATRNILSFCN